MVSPMAITYVLADLGEGERMAVAAVLDDPLVRDVCHAFVFIRSPVGQWSATQLNNRLVGVHLARAGDTYDAICTAIDGGVCEISKTQQSWSLVETGAGGPNTLVPLTTSRRIGDTLVVAGMQRRVYAHSPSGWSRIDQGCRIEANDPSIGGFLSIDGASLELMWAVGYHGEIWKRQTGAWERVDSPTNAKLIAVRQLTDGTVMVAGASGTAFIGDRESWREINGLDRFAAIAIENFGEETYVAVRGGALFVLRGYELERVNACIDFPVYGMTAHAHSLFAVGPLGLRMLDKTGWHEVPAPIQVAQYR